MKIRAEIIMICQYSLVQTVSVICKGSYQTLNKEHFKEVSYLHKHSLE